MKYPEDEEARRLLKWDSEVSHIEDLHIRKTVAVLLENHNISFELDPNYALGRTWDEIKKDVIDTFSNLKAYQFAYIEPMMRPHNDIVCAVTRKLHHREMVSISDQIDGEIAYDLLDNIQMFHRREIDFKNLSKLIDSSNSKFIVCDKCEWEGKNLIRLKVFPDRTVIIVNEKANKKGSQYCYYPFIIGYCKMEPLPEIRNYNRRGKKLNASLIPNYTILTW